MCYVYYCKLLYVLQVKFLCSHGASVNTCDQYKRSPLMHASHRGNIELMRLLLDTGCDIHAHDFQQRTALFYATHGGHNEAIQFLIQSGAQVRKVIQEAEMIWKNNQNTNSLSFILCSN